MARNTRNGPGLTSPASAGQPTVYLARHGQVRARNMYTYRFPGGESYADAESRAARALDLISRSGRPLVVSHEMIGRLLLRRLGVPDALGTQQPSDVVYRVAGDSVVDRLSWSGEVPTEFRFRSL